MTDHYEISLNILHRLLHKSGNNHWANWIKKDIEFWNKEKSVKHHLGAFGGMGSINDLWVGGEDKSGIWENLIFEEIKNLSWNLAKRRIKEAPKSDEFYRNGNGQMSGWRCRNCGLSRLDENKVEYHLSNKFLPKKIAHLVKNEKLENLLPIESWINELEIETERAKIIESLKETDIQVGKNNSWLKVCPSCESDNVCVYRWEYDIEENKIVESSDNLKMKRSQHTTMRKTIIASIRRLLRLR